MGAIQGGPFGPALYPSGSAHLGQMQSKNPSQGPLPVIAPKPPSLSYQGHENTTYGHYTQARHGQPVYELNSGQPVQLPYTQANTSVSPQTTAGYVKIEHDPRSHHFERPPNGQVGNSYSTSRPPTTTDGPDEAQEEYIDAQFLDDDELDEDAEMGESDDESRDPQEVLGPMVKQFNGSWDADGTQVRAFSSFAKCNVLSEYTASAQTSELKDARILAIFMHFIQVTGPSMSLYERHPFDHGYDDAYDTTPRGSNNLWSCEYVAVNNETLG